MYLKYNKPRQWLPQLSQSVEPQASWYTQETPPHPYMLSEALSCEAREVRARLSPAAR